MASHKSSLLSSMKASGAPVISPSCLLPIKAASNPVKHTSNKNTFNSTSTNRNHASIRSQVKQACRRRRRTRRRHRLCPRSTQDQKEGGALLGHYRERVQTVAGSMTAQGPLAALFALLIQVIFGQQESRNRSTHIGQEEHWHRTTSATP
ncbi:hypothetical protein K457DRAFT_27687 [Linnemannia elongata AG-77]|uniref:Uncharacterized protein n=1 Tax=Linnemannia elongata AG-77 TaxID=1314771 RepID=A0A197KGH4_9FUNG|nr:hypothetical protein K457DRAFT_27687 [Linnemannia elongata AG-77]